MGHFRLHFHNAYMDPLGWYDDTPFTVHQFCVEEITRLLRAANSKPTTLVIDSLSWILRHVDCPTVCRTLHQLRKGDKWPSRIRKGWASRCSRHSTTNKSCFSFQWIKYKSFSASLCSSVFSLGGAARVVIGLLHADMHQQGTVGSVGHLATSVITVAPGTKPDKTVAKITKRLRSGKVIQDVCISTLGLFFLHYSRMLSVCFFLLIGGSFQHPGGFYSHVSEDSQPSEAQTYWP